MKKLLLFFLFLCSFIPVFAKHITGGEVTYTFQSSNGTSTVYTVTLILFRDNTCVGCSAMPASVTLGVFDNDDNTRLFLRAIDLGSIQPLDIVSSPPCLTNAPELDYSAGYYVTSISVPNNLTGFTVSYQTCCRVDGITNINGVSAVGATYVGEIPGTAALQGGHDNSATFQTGISILCNNKHFLLDFSATDQDHDSLVYSFADAYNGGEAADAGFADPAPPPYGSVPYGPAPYSGNTPLGSQATINSATGIISGIAPDAGKYIVCVVVKSYRNGLLVAEHRKDFIVTVAPCDFASADLPAVIRECDTFTKTFQNENDSPLNLTFLWDFGDPASGANNTSTQEVVTHTYADTGVYHLTLIVNAGQPCADTAHADVLVFPGFFPAIKYIPPMCKDLPVQFTDSTKTSYGTVNYWHWDFGNPPGGTDTSRLQNPVYTYHTAGTYDIQLIVGSTKGCLDTLKPSPQVIITDRPDFHVNPHDTLICVVDTLQILTGAGTGTITWSPNYAISDIHSFNPLVSPDITTTYSALYVDPVGCTIIDSARIRVTNGVSLSKQADTTLCSSDSAVLHISSNALYYSWTPPDKITDPTVQNPTIHPTDPLTPFTVHASISAKCFSDATINVRSVPYPDVVITGDSTICYGNSAQLHASGGSSYVWTPIAYLTNTHIPDPVSQQPKANITYTVTVTDTLGCPKPVSKDFTVQVIRLTANAGSADTSVVIDQPVQLHVTDNGGTIYLWTPSTYLDNPNISNPVALPQNDITYLVRVSNEIGCFATDTVRVHVFDLAPGLYVPSAFTPGKDGLNDLFRPIALGIQTLVSFRVFDRWGTLMFETNRIYDGWDGSYKGRPQDSGTFVWEAHAVDYKGKPIYMKGSVILIR
jgi:gliding motility-associated-like protein